MDNFCGEEQIDLEFVSTSGGPLGVDDRALRRSLVHGEWVRLRRGVYLSAAEWRGLTDRGRHLARVRSVVGIRPDVVVGFESAAALWDFPRLGRWPDEVHLVSQPGSGAHSRSGVREHRVAFTEGDVICLDGLAVTTPARTLIDVARSCATLDAVVMIDHALNHPTSPRAVGAEAGSLAELARDRIGLRGRAKALRAIAASRSGAASPGETWSRLLIEQFGMPEPRLQTQHVNPRGGFYYTDFEWPELAIIGEFDGRGKYLKPEYLGTMTPGEAVVAEKVREDHLRGERNGFARWTFDDLRDPSRLRDILTAAGVPTLGT